MKYGEWTSFSPRKLEAARNFAPATMSSDAARPIRPTTMRFLTGLFDLIRTYAKENA
ncbi:hypothetical protein D3C85_1861240 [compost metagenome]